MNRHAAHAYKAVAMIDLLTGYFDGGKRWICLEWHEGANSVCAHTNVKISSFLPSLSRHLLHRR